MSACHDYDGAAACSLSDCIRDAEKIAGYQNVWKRPKKRREGSARLLRRRFGELIRANLVGPAPDGYGADRRQIGLARSYGVGVAGAAAAVGGR